MQQSFRQNSTVDQATSSKTSRKFTVLAMAVALTLLNGCGGGGGSETPTAVTPAITSDTSSAPVSAAAQSTIVTASASNSVDFLAYSTKTLDPGIAGCTVPDSKIQFSVNTGFSFSQQDQESEFTELLNHLRCLAALPALTRLGNLDIAAQKHVDYSIANNTVTHSQDANKTGFSGANPGDRMANPTSWGEIVSKTGSSARESFDGLTAAIYHRFVMLSPQFNQVGVGLKQAPGTTDMVTVADYAAASVLNSDRVIAFPAAGQINVAPAFNTDYETPDPIAGADFVGYPVSLQSDRGTKLTITTFEIRRAGTSAVLDAYIRGTGADADINLESHAAFLATKQPLEAGVQYNVTFVGSVLKDNTEKPVTMNWSFTTAPKQLLAVAETLTPELNKFTRVKLSGCGSTYKWQYTAGLEVKVYSNQWMQVKALKSGPQWVEITDSCGATKRIEFTVQ